jgi:amino acid permease
MEDNNEQTTTQPLLPKQQSTNSATNTNDEENNNLQLQLPPPTPILITITRTNSELYLHPSFDDSTSRQLFLPYAIFTIVGTMVGGGMLSLPFAFSRIGLVVGIIVLGLSAILADFTYFQLIQASRLMMTYDHDSVTDAFDGLAFTLLGERGKMFLLGVLWLATFTASMSYIILASTLMDDVYTAAAAGTNSKSSETPHHGSTMLLFIIMSFPISLPKKIDSLRNTSTLAVLGAVVVALVVLQAAIREPHSMNELNLWPKSIADFFYSLPFFVISFVAHFSILPAHRELIIPTQQRARTMTRFSSLVGFCIYGIIGISGYIYAGQDVCDSIFSNLPKGVGITLARVGLIVILYLSFPLLIQPTRTCTFALTNIESTPKRHVIVTFLIIISAGFFAFIMPSVSVVFSFAGSTINVLIAITFPCLLAWRAWGVVIDRSNNNYLSETSSSTTKSLIEIQRWRKILMGFIVGSILFGISSTIASGMRVGVECNVDSNT